MWSCFQNHDSNFWHRPSKRLHGEKYLRNHIKSAWNQIVFTIFRMIWNLKGICLDPNQSENDKYNLISAWFSKIQKKFLCVCIHENHAGIYQNYVGKYKLMIYIYIYWEFWFILHMQVKWGSNSFTDSERMFVFIIIKLEIQFWSKVEFVMQIFEFTKLLNLVSNSKNCKIMLT